MERENSQLYKYYYFLVEFQKKIQQHFRLVLACQRTDDMKDEILNEREQVR